MNPELEIYPYSFFRFDGLALGAILAVWVRSRYYSRSSAWRLAGLLIGASCLIGLIGLPFGVTGTKTVVGTAFHYSQAEMVFAGLMALTLAYRGSAALAFLRCRPARITADLSYCIYLIHLTVGDLYYRLLHAIRFDDVARLGAIIKARWDFELWQLERLPSGLRRYPRSSWKIHSSASSGTFEYLRVRVDRELAQRVSLGPAADVRGEPPQFLELLCHPKGEDAGTGVRGPKVSIEQLRQCDPNLLRLLDLNRAQPSRAVPRSHAA
jgi:hypothetical protein